MGMQSGNPRVQYQREGGQFLELPPWSDGSSERVTLRLTRRQAEQWRLREDILRECSRKANPHAAIVSETLSLTEPGPNFQAAQLGLTRSGELEAVRKYERNSGKLNVTREGDVQSNVSRLPSVMRKALLIGGRSVVEFDVTSAHAVLLGVFYDGETGDQWYSERSRFMEQAERGFASIYGVGKVWKRGFLAALNQPTESQGTPARATPNLNAFFLCCRAKWRG